MKRMSNALALIVSLSLMSIILTGCPHGSGKVVPKSNTKPAPGSILLDDGSWIKVNDVAAMDVATLGTRQVLGILAYDIAGKPYCVAPNTSGYTKLMIEEAKGWNLNIEAMQGTESDGKTGKENLAALKTVVDDYSQTNYPAFYWAENYGDGNWYIPSIWELKKVFSNKDVISVAFKKLNEIDSTYTSEDFSNGIWSSSQDADDNKNAMLVYPSGYVGREQKNGTYTVLVVQAFSY